MSPLPPLSALRAFEAAARHLNFSRAADELAVTPGAVSQQIRTLETHLGLSLVDRSGRRLELTPIARSNRTFGAPVAMDRPRRSFGERADASISVPSTDRNREVVASPVRQAKEPSRRSSAAANT